MITRALLMFAVLATLIAIADGRGAMPDSGSSSKSGSMKKTQSYDDKYSKKYWKKYWGHGHGDDSKDGDTGSNDNDDMKGSHSKVDSNDDSKGDRNKYQMKDSGSNDDDKGTKDKDSSNSSDNKDGKGSKDKGSGNSSDNKDGKGSKDKDSGNSSHNKDGKGSMDKGSGNSSENKDGKGSKDKGSGNSSENKDGKGSKDKGSGNSSENKDGKGSKDKGSGNSSENKDGKGSKDKGSGNSSENKDGKGSKDKDSGNSSDNKDGKGSKDKDSGNSSDNKDGKGSKDKDSGNSSDNKDGKGSKDKDSGNSSDNKDGKGSKDKDSGNSSDNKDGKGSKDKDSGNSSDNKDGKGSKDKDSGKSSHNKDGKGSMDKDSGNSSENKDGKGSMDKGSGNGKGSKDKDSGNSSHNKDGKGSMDKGSGNSSENKDGKGSKDKGSGNSSENKDGKGSKDKGSGNSSENKDGKGSKDKGSGNSSENKDGKGSKDKGSGNSSENKDGKGSKDKDSGNSSDNKDGKGSKDKDSGNSSDNKDGKGSKDKDSGKSSHNKDGKGSMDKGSGNSSENKDGKGSMDKGSGDGKGSNDKGSGNSSENKDGKGSKDKGSGNSSNNKDDKGSMDKGSGNSSENKDGKGSKDKGSGNSSNNKDDKGSMDKGSGNSSENKDGKGSKDKGSGNSSENKDGKGSNDKGSGNSSENKDGKGSKDKGSGNSSENKDGKGSKDKGSGNSSNNKDDKGSMDKGSGNSSENKDGKGSKDKGSGNSSENKDGKGSNDKGSGNSSENKDGKGSNDKGSGNSSENKDGKGSKDKDSGNSSENKDDKGSKDKDSGNSSHNKDDKGSMDKGSGNSSENKDGKGSKDKGSGNSSENKDGKGSKDKGSGNSSENKDGKGSKDKGSGNSSENKDGKGSKDKGSGNSSENKDGKGSKDKGSGNSSENKDGKGSKDKGSGNSSENKDGKGSKDKGSGNSSENKDGKGSKDKGSGNSSENKDGKGSKDKGSGNSSENKDGKGSKDKGSGNSSNNKDDKGSMDKGSGNSSENKDGKGSKDKGSGNSSNNKDDKGSMDKGSGNSSENKDGKGSKDKGSGNSSENKDGKGSNDKGSGNSSENKDGKGSNDKGSGNSSENKDGKGSKDKGSGNSSENKDGKGSNDKGSGNSSENKDGKGSNDKGSGNSSENKDDKGSKDKDSGNSSHNKDDKGSMDKGSSKSSESKDDKGSKDKDSSKSSDSKDGKGSNDKGSSKSSDSKDGKGSKDKGSSKSSDSKDDKGSKDKGSSKSSDSKDDKGSKDKGSSKSSGSKDDKGSKDKGSSKSSDSKDDKGSKDKGSNKSSDSKDDKGSKDKGSSKSSGSKDDKGSKDKGSSKSSDSKDDKGSKDKGSSKSSGSKDDKGSKDKGSSKSSGSKDDKGSKDKGSSKSSDSKDSSGSSDSSSSKDGPCKGEVVWWTCESWSIMPKKCGNTEGIIGHVELVKEKSYNECEYGDSWGYTDTYIWVKSGCRAHFKGCVGNGQVDGNWSPWSDYATCSRTCGSGTHTRRRTCSNPAPSKNGADCVGVAVEQSECNTQPCPVDGGWTKWSDYGSCSKTCGTGSQSRSRSCTNPEPANNGKNCHGVALEEKPCNKQPCPVDGGWTSWSDYGSCSKTCGTGRQSRSRSCTNPRRSIHGRKCVGDDEQERSCNTKPCPVDGGWTKWSDYGSCSKTCGTGSQTRSRSCTNPKPANNGKTCVGIDMEKRDCNKRPCPIAGGWTPWSDYGTCSRSCGTGSQSRSRSCTNPKPANNGAECSGESFEEKTCNKQPCPVDGGWSRWSMYGACSHTCGIGSQSHSRTCTNPTPSNNGRDCVGETKDVRKCNNRPCPVDGGWTTWSDYGFCSKTCGAGKQSRMRSCTNPEPAYNGKGCVGDKREERVCNNGKCPVDGEWSPWSEYGPCSKTCATGSQLRSRTCTNPSPSNNGRDCIGEDTDANSCNTKPCPIGEKCNGETMVKTCESTNNKYEKCDFSLGQSSIKSVRVEKLLSNKACERDVNWGFDETSIWVDGGCRAEFELCLGVDGNWSPWSSFDSCSRTCGSGSHSRRRTCSNPAPSRNGADCVGNAKEQMSCNNQPCPVDGGWTKWSGYGACSKTCGTGRQSRSRSCTNPEPANDGKDCVGDTIDEKDCNKQPCPVNGGWSKWSDYGSCSKDCGSGIQTRSRTCTNPKPMHKGLDCVGDDEEDRSCNTKPCPVDGGWTKWSGYGTCSKTCGTGSQSRSRSCTNPEPANNGKDCVGDARDQRDCNKRPCPVDGGWTPWSDYDTCSRTCGTGSQSRRRSCTNPEPANGGKSCPGDRMEERSCNTKLCPVDGGWSRWSMYGACSHTCGTGSQSRSRTCTNPSPSNNGMDCVGDADEIRSCNNRPCPVDGEWTTWSDYGSCSKTCGTGSKSRSRSCTNPEPANNGKNCVGESFEEKDCNKQKCPVDGEWSRWTDYGPCSKTCATGSQLRSRTCTNPSPSNNGRDCIGDDTEAKSCNRNPCPTGEKCKGQTVVKTCESSDDKYEQCDFSLGPKIIKGARVEKMLSNKPCERDVNWGFEKTSVWVIEGCRAEFELCLGVDGNWSPWSDYDSCSRTCGSGSQSRRRTCSNPAPSNNGAGCVGNADEQTICNIQPCPVDGGWAKWSGYGSCSKTCGTGSQSRSRSCTNPEPANNGKDCEGDAREQRDCNKQLCPVDGGWSSWSNYGSCTKDCGSGYQFRTRTCTNPKPSNKGRDCVGDDEEDRSCNTKPCPVDGGWTRWSGYGDCSKTCGTGSQSRSRSCTNPEPANNGKDCVGDARDQRDCNKRPCPVDGGWTPWSDYDTCSRTCGTGSQTRRRSCTNPEPANGGKNCPGDGMEDRSCNTKLCPVDGGWSRWSVYGACSQTCGTGSQSRSRTCTNPSPSNNGRDCVGNADENRSCHNRPCPVDGGWTPWSDYGSCSKTCGTGSRSRSRSCTNPEPANNGKTCVGEDFEEKDCNKQLCPVDGQWSSWTEYGPCSKTCATGSQLRSRSCNNPSPSNNGKDCIGKGVEAKSCNTKPCPIGEKCDGKTVIKTCESFNDVYEACHFSLGQSSIKSVRVEKLLSNKACERDVNWGFDETSIWVDGGCRAEFELCLGVDGNWSPWSEYGSCSKTCGSGSRTRGRTCSNPAPSKNGADCVGNADEQTRCNNQLCPVDGGWTKWSGYGACSKTCGTGSQSRSRSCTNPEPANNGKDCVGDARDQRDCNKRPCPVDGGWSEWSDYGSCTKTCGTGSQSRSRTCTNPRPLNNGLDCFGDDEEERSCNTKPCPVDGGWTRWSGYGDCSKTCGTGSQSRSRSCTNPEPANNGKDCVGDARDQRDCNKRPCPVDGSWTPWSDYGSCSKTCGTGSQSRRRSCTNPEPANGGKDCPGDRMEDRDCNTKLCPVDGGWSRWSMYGACSRTCGTGSQSRTRTCTNPSPSNDGLDCVGEAGEVRSCNKRPCPVDGGWTTWSDYGSCSKTCGTGSKSRSRSCTNPEPANNGKNCEGNDFEEKDCNKQKCPVDGEWSPWSEYGPCSKTCATGSQLRSRTCTNPSPSNNGKDCIGEDTDANSCNTKPCPIEEECKGQMEIHKCESWNDNYEKCEFSLGEKTIKGVRVEKLLSNSPCQRDIDWGFDETSVWVKDSCRAEFELCLGVDGNWSPWSEYGSCSKTCGSGSRTRGRSCSNPAPSENGADCVGNAEEKTSCNIRPCPVDGGWTKWSGYGACSKTCGTGSQSRSRSCTNPEPANNGRDCEGDAIDDRDCNNKPCPVDGGWTSWSEYGSCSKTCGTGRQSRSRSCTNPRPSNKGLDCVGDDEEDRSCNTKPCPVDGGWTKWSGYGACSKTCGTGSQSRSRSCTNPEPANNGKDCVGDATAKRGCNKQPCPVDGGWSKWSDYGSCSKTCGTGSQSRSRSCSNPIPSNKGLDCVGDDEEDRGCNKKPCPVDGGWTPWSDYDTCSKTCGTGSQSRRRSCTNPEPANSGKDCVGEDFEEKVCNTKKCPVDGGWSRWSVYGACSRTCGTGSQSRSRTCTNPSPSNNGRDCVGNADEDKRCNTQPCPVDGGWTKWSGYDACSKTCGSGIQTRSRSCTNPEPANNGKDCEGDVYEDRDCNKKPCPVDGEWSPWTDYGPCSKTCATGSQLRSRTCTNPSPSNNGKDCVGEASEAKSCNTKPCPIGEKCHGHTVIKTCESLKSKYNKCDFSFGQKTIKSVRVEKLLSNAACKRDVNWGFDETSIWVDDNCRAEFELCLGVDGDWTPWSNYGGCSKTCGGGKKSRSRTCSNPAPSSNGANCVGDSSEQVHCNGQPCPVDGGWSTWSPYGPCSTSCGVGSQSRDRTCTNPPPENNGADCGNNNYEQRSCNDKPCPVDGGWTDWSDFGPCSKTCGDGTQNRNRSCTNPAPSNNGAGCVGRKGDKRSCNIQPCPVDGGWSRWGRFGRCSKTCGNGVQSRGRTCTKPSPANNGADCVGDDKDERKCNPKACPVDGEWSPWSDFGTCSKTCGGGVQYRNRSCTNPSPSNKGADCVGKEGDERSCNPKPCPIDGGWSTWSEYGPCSTTCGEGAKRRSRTCTNPAPSNNGKDCVGKDQEVDMCNLFKLCPVDGEWSPWSGYSSCSKSCGSGTQSRTRTCSDPAPSNNGADCVGQTMEEISCNTKPCPTDGGWSRWTSYGPCSKSCGSGTKSRTRSCTNPSPSKNGADCVGDDEDDRDCNKNPCPPAEIDGGWTKWSGFGPCSKSCGSGVKARTRTCTNPTPSENGADCVGNDIKEKKCNTRPCPRERDGGWARWSKYGPCSATCGLGTRTRTRKCTKPRPSKNGADCVGDAQEEKECQSRPCPSDENTMQPPYDKPDKCKDEGLCCEQGQLKVNLGSKTLKPKNKKEGSLKGVKVGKFSRGTKQSCSQTVVITVDFERIDNNTCFGCLPVPFYGRRMLKIDLELSNAGRDGWLFNIGDSQSNDGSGNDNSDQENDAEVAAQYPDITVFPSEKCADLDRIMYIMDGCTSTVHTVTLYVSNEFVRITNNDGLDYHVCSGCLFALNGQSDSGTLGENERVHIGLNRVLSGLSKVGYGVCSATMTWTCPWCD